MSVQFVAQPFEDGTDLRDFLHAVAAAPQLSTLRMVVAWAKRSGLSRAESDLKAIRERGARVQAIVGVSEGGATEQGLRQLINLVDEAWVFHDAGRTFHPKVYLAEGNDDAHLLVGSHNLTAGGIAWNYEAGLWCRLDLTATEDRKLRDDVVGYFDRLRADVGVCLPLDEALIDSILADESLMIQDEGARRRPASPDPDAPEESDSSDNASPASSAPRVFGTSQAPKRSAPSVIRLPHPLRPRRPAPAIGAVPGAPHPLTVVKRWFKQMDGTAAQQPPSAASNPTGNLRLSQEAFSIDHTTYFRQIFFGGLDWRPSARVADMEELWVSVQTVIAGDYLGDVDLRISHQPSRISNQGNVPTVLHWGDLGQRLRQNNYIGLYATLERGSGDQFALTIGDQPTGQFAY